MAGASAGVRIGFGNCPGIVGKQPAPSTGVKRDADKKQIRNAYFEMSKLFHPDAYFGKRVGSYKSKMETVFKRRGRRRITIRGMERPRARGRRTSSLKPCTTA